MHDRFGRGQRNGQVRGFGRIGPRIAVSHRVAADISHNQVAKCRRPCFTEEKLKAPCVRKWLRLNFDHDHVPIFKLLMVTVGHSNGDLVFASLDTL